MQAGSRKGNVDWQKDIGTNKEEDREAKPSRLEQTGRQRQARLHKGGRSAKAGIPKEANRQKEA
jgi:hypothetical protein